MNSEVITSKLDYLKAKVSGINNYTAHIIKYSLLLISAIYTILLFQSQASSLFSKSLQSVLGGIIELAKYELPVVAIVGVIMGGKKVHWGLRIVAGLLAIWCFYYSIQATKGYQLVEAYDFKERSFKASDIYKGLKSQLDSKQSQLETAMINQSKIIELEKQSNNQNNSLANQLHKDVSSLQSQIRSKNGELQSAINKNSKKPCPSTIKRLNKELQQLQDSMGNSYKQLQNIQPSSALTLNNEAIKTLNIDIKALNTQIEKEENNYKTKGGYGILFSSPKEFSDFINGLATLIEFVGIFFSIIVGIKSRNKKIKKITTVYYDGEENLYTGTSTPLPQPQSQVVTAKAGFDISNCVSEKQPENTCIQASTSNDIELMEAVKAYAEQALSSVKSDNSCDGLTKIANRVEKHTRNDLLKAKSYLEQKKLLEVRGNTTYITDTDELKKYA